MTTFLGPIRTGKTSYTTLIIESIIPSGEGFYEKYCLHNWRLLELWDNHIPTQLKNKTYYKYTLII